MVDVVPYILSSGGVGGQVQVQREEIGIKLHILPTVNTDDVGAVELNDVASALNRTRNQQITRITEVQQSSGLESLIKGALGIAAGYYLGQAIGGSTGTGGQTSQGHTTILRGYRCTLHPTAFNC